MIFNKRTNFEAVNIGELFILNGCALEKKSSRTAWLSSFNGSEYKRQSMYFYVGKSEQVYRSVAE